jgi:hypothetical protein
MRAVALMLTLTLAGCGTAKTPADANSPFASASGIARPAGENESFRVVPLRYGDPERDQSETARVDQ